MYKERIQLYIIYTIYCYITSKRRNSTQPLRLKHLELLKILHKYTLHISTTESHHARDNRESNNNFSMPFTYGTYIGIYIYNSYTTIRYIYDTYMTTAIFENKTRNNNFLLWSVFVVVVVVRRQQSRYICCLYFIQRSARSSWLIIFWSIVESRMNARHRMPEETVCYIHTDAFIAAAVAVAALWRKKVLFSAYKILVTAHTYSCTYTTHTPMCAYMYYMYYI